MRRWSFGLAALFLFPTNQLGCAERSGPAGALPQHPHRMSVEVELKAYLDREHFYVQWEGWRWRNMDGQAIDPVDALPERNTVIGGDTVIIQLSTSDGESLTTLSEDVERLRKVIVDSGHPPDRLIVYAVSNDFRRKVADVVRDYGDGEPPTKVKK